MLKYSSFREFPFYEMDGPSSRTNNKNSNNKYQKYIDKLNEYYSDNYYIQNIRVLKNFFDEEKYTLKTKYRLNQDILRKMFEITDSDYNILEINETWIGEKFINEDNMNDGINEWFIKLKQKIDLTKLDYIGGGNDNLNSNLVDFLGPKYTPEYLIRYDHQNKKYKVPIVVIKNGKMYDKIWYHTENPNIYVNEIYTYIKYYINHYFKQDDNKYFIKNIMMTNDGWYVNINI